MALATGLFVHLNGNRLCASQAHATAAMMAVAAGDMSEAEFAPWLRVHVLAERNARRG